VRWAISDKKLLGATGLAGSSGCSRRPIGMPIRRGDGALRTRLKELALQRRRFGYRRLGPLLARQGAASITRGLIGSAERSGCSCVSAVAANGHLVS
jgi:hypothetical protein